MSARQRPTPEVDPAYVERLRVLDGMVEAGDLTSADRSLAVQRARGAVLRSRPLPAVPKRSRQMMLDAEAKRVAKKAERVTDARERLLRETEAIAEQRRARDQALDRQRGVFDLALAEGRMSKQQHAAALARLDTIAAQDPQQIPKQKGRVASFFDALDNTASWS